MFIFASDNGVQWGEHGCSDKALPYEESIRVPIMTKGPGVTAPKVINQMVSWNLDLAATIYDIAGITEAHYQAHMVLSDS